MSKLNITTCPTCGGKRIKKVRKTVTGTREGRRYSAPDIEFYECPDCDEKVYEAEAIRQIEKYSIPPAKRRPIRKTV